MPSNSKNIINETRMARMPGVSNKLIGALCLLMLMSGIITSCDEVEPGLSISTIDPNINVNDTTTVVNPGDSIPGDSVPQRYNKVLDFIFGSDHNAIRPLSNFMPHLQEEYLDTIFLNNKKGGDSFLWLVTGEYLPPVYNETVKAGKVLRGMGHPIENIVNTYYSIGGLTDDQVRFLGDTLRFKLKCLKGYEFLYPDSLFPGMFVHNDKPTEVAKQNQQKFIGDTLKLDPKTGEYNKQAKYTDAIIAQQRKKLKTK